MDLKRSDKSQFGKCLKNWLHDRPYYHILSEFLLDTIVPVTEKQISQKQRQNKRAPLDNPNTGNSAASLLTV